MPKTATKSNLWPTAAFPPELSSMMATGAAEWLASPSRPKPDDDTLRHWDGLVTAWVNDPAQPLLLRRSGVRGLEQRHTATGRSVICVDNSPAHWTLASAIGGARPSISDLLDALTTGEWPVMFAMSKADA